MPSRLERRRPALVGRRVEQDRRLPVGREPAVAGHFLVELALAPAGIAERDDPARRPAAFGDRLQARRSSRSSRTARRSADDLERVLPAPVVEWRTKPAARLDRPAVVDRRSRAPRRDRCRAASSRPRKLMPARLWPMPMPTAPFSSWTHIAITARSKRGSAMPGIASSSLPDRKRGVVHRRRQCASARSAGKP